MAITIKKDVFWFEVSVYESHAVQMIQGKNQLCCIEPCLGFSEPYFLPQMIEKLPSICKVKDKVDPLRRLKGIME